MVSSRRSRMWGALALVGALALGVGCVAETGSAPEPTEGSSQALAQGSQGADGKEGPAGPHAGRRHPGPGGPEVLLFAALHELDLTDAQEAAIQGALDKAAPGPRERGPREGAPLGALAAGVRAGKIDAPAVLAKVGSPNKGAEERMAAVAGAIQTLHATLTEEQRRELVDVLEERAAEHGPAGRRDDRRPAGPPPGEEGEAGPEAARPLAHLLRGLELTDAQREEVGRALEAQRPTTAQREAMRERMEAVHEEMRARLEAFAGASFDAKAFLAPPAGADARGPAGMAHPLERLVKDLAVVVPILEPAQREALAALLEKAPPMGPPPGARGPGPRGGAPAR